MLPVGKRIMLKGLSWRILLTDLFIGIDLFLPAHVDNLYTKKTLNSNEDGGNVVSACKEKQRISRV